MSLKRSCISLFLLGLGLLVAGSAQALDFSLVGGGGQLHIGNGLALPIQQANTVLETGTNFPALGIPVRPGPAPIITGTVAKPKITVGTRSGYQRRLHVPVGVLSKAGGQTTVGVKFSNTTLFAVGTNLKFTWPAAPALFSTGNAVATTTVTGFGGKMIYSNTLGQRFGGPAHFSLSAGATPAGQFPAHAVTIYAKITGATDPPCTHTAPFFGGAQPSCIAGLLVANPSGLAGQGGVSTATVMTPGGFGTGANIVAQKMGAAPTHVSGTLLPGIAAPALTKPYAVRVAAAPLPSNMASSQGGPWTTGQIIISQPLANNGGEKFTLTGKDMRTAGGGGTIQLVGGAVSDRAFTNENANRGWIRLELAPVAGVPSMSIPGLAATAGLLVLTAGYMLRRRIFA